METAKVDIRKLQLLNDRINQCIDALTQVRLSVHGLSHTSGINPNVNVPNVGLGSFGAVQQGFPQLPQTGFAPPFASGLSHSPMINPQLGFNPYAGFGGAQAGINPYLGFAGVPVGATPFQPGWNPYAASIGGLSHTGLDTLEPYGRPTWGDPLLAAKVAQTFPCVQFAVPPVVTLY
jgi:hypothetical protein